MASNTSTGPSRAQHLPADIVFADPDPEPRTLADWCAYVDRVNSDPEGSQEAFWGTSPYSGLPRVFLRPRGAMDIATHRPEVVGSGR